VVSIVSVEDGGVGRAVQEDKPGVARKAGGQSCLGAMALMKYLRLLAEMSPGPDERAMPSRFQIGSSAAMGLPEYLKSTEEPVLYVEALFAQAAGEAFGIRLAEPPLDRATEPSENSPHPNRRGRA